MRLRNRWWWLAWLLLWPLGGMAAEDPVVAAAERIVAEAGEHGIVVIGEMHGTREAPAVVAALAVHYAARDPVLVGLEVSRSEHEALSEYMRSDGSDAAREQMRAGEFWDVPPERNDGRRTEDMLDLVESLRGLRVEGRDVAVVPFDIASGAFVDRAARDRDMAVYLRTAFEALPRGRMLVLTGKAHAMRKLPPMFDDGGYRTATQLLADLEPFTVHLTASSGGIWTCSMGSCGVRRMGMPMKTGVFGDQFHFWYALPEYTVARLIGED
ncbi:MAG: calcium-binding protein [Luteimonas sp.]